MKLKEGKGREKTVIICYGELREAEVGGGIYQQNLYGKDGKVDSKHFTGSEGEILLGIFGEALVQV